MKYTINLHRKIETNTIDSLMVLITEDRDEYLKAWHDLTIMLERNKTFIKSQEFKNEDVTRLYLEYDFNRGY